VIKRIVIHALGFITIALGIAALITSRLGASPADAFHYFLSEISPIKIGTYAIITSFVLAFVSYMLERKKDIMIGFLFSIILGVFINIWLDSFFTLFSLTFLNNLLVRIILAVSAIVLIALGTSMTLITKLPTSPYDRMMVIISRRTKSISLAKLIVESSFMVFALTMGFIAASINPSIRIWDQIFVFTFLLMILVGPVIHIFVYLFNQLQRKEV